MKKEISVPKDTLTKQTQWMYVDSFDQNFQSAYQEGGLPGFALSIFTKDTIILQKGYGYANLEDKTPMTPHTVQGIASISKTFIAVALMQAVEAGKISLDTKINDILPFEVVLPDTLSGDITIQHLATHTSGISDEGNYDRAYVFYEELKDEIFPKVWWPHLAKYRMNETMPYEAFLQKTFDPNGEWASPENFNGYAPGTYFDYSNIGAGLLAYCVAISTGTDYKDNTTEQIIETVGMGNTTWEYNQVDPKQHITYYNEIHNPVPRYEVINYPDGGLYTTVHDLTLYLQEMMKGFHGNSDLLSPNSFQKMMTDQIPDLDVPTGIIWDMDNSCCIGHGGNDFGIATMMYFEPETGIGRILFCNITIETDELADDFYTIFNEMFRYKDEIQKQF